MSLCKTQKLNRKVIFMTINKQELTWEEAVSTGFITKANRGFAIPYGTITQVGQFSEYQEKTGTVGAEFSGQGDCILPEAMIRDSMSVIKLGHTGSIAPMKGDVLFLDYVTEGDLYQITIKF